MCVQGACTYEVPQQGPVYHIDRVESDLHAADGLIPAVLHLTAQEAFHLPEVSLELFRPFILEALSVSAEDGPEEPLYHIVALDAIGRGGEEPAVSFLAVAHAREAFLEQGFAFLSCG